MFWHSYPNYSRPIVWRETAEKKLFYKNKLYYTYDEDKPYKIYYEGKARQVKISLGGSRPSRNIWEKIRRFIPVRKN